MIRLPNKSLPQTAQRQLRRWQREIDGIPGYVEQVAAAKKQFSARNKVGNQTFGSVKATLTTMCSGAQRCGYCEDSAADEVEHIKPKDLYPEVVFVWENYLYSCGPCNGPKNNQFAVFSHETGNKTDVTRKRGTPVVPPEVGDPVLFNPRQEDALQYMELDLLGTFLFLPLYGLAPKEYQRAQYTIEVLRLNERELLLRARKEAYGSYKARLSEYITERDKGATQARLNKLIKAVQTMQHPTVWKEMQRQQALIPELKKLFAKAPEALIW